MKKLIVTLICCNFIFVLNSCRKEKDLKEVTITGPEKSNEKVEMGNPADVKAEDPDGAFQMKGLPYAYNALEPFIDAQTMETHYSKHHLKYCDKLNAAVKGTPMAGLSIEEIFKKLDLKNSDVRNNAGGYYNHNFFFASLAANAGGEPTGSLLEAINADFGSFEDFKTQFTEKSTKLFGSGWTWLVLNKEGKLAITTTSNQDNTLMSNAEVKGKPILALDVWEHAYYLKYKNKRADYIEAFYNVINWKKIQENYDQAVE